MQRLSDEEQLSVEAESFACFCALMLRVEANFSSDTRRVVALLLLQLTCVRVCVCASGACVCAGRAPDWAGRPPRCCCRGMHAQLSALRQLVQLLDPPLYSFLEVSASLCWNTAQRASVAMRCRTD